MGNTLKLNVYKGRHIAHHAEYCQNNVDIATFYILGHAYECKKGYQRLVRCHIRAV